MSGLITTLDQINDNISNFEELSNERKKDFLSKYYATPTTTYYLAYHCSGSEKYHFLWGKYIGYEWGGVDKYDPDVIRGHDTQKNIRKVLHKDPTYSDDLWHDFVDYSELFGFDVSSKKEKVSFWVLDRENVTTNCYLRFKKLLEYFVAHLEYNENYLDGVFPEINQSITKGYDQYIFPQKGSFVRTGTGYDGGRIQNAVNQWAEYDSGKICLNVSPSYGKYTTALCYLNWKDTSVNVNACWVNKQVVGLKACFVVKKESEEKFKKKGEETIVPETSLNDLGLFDNTASTNDRLKDFFNKFYELIIPA